MLNEISGSERCFFLHKDADVFKKVEGISRVEEVIPKPQCQGHENDNLPRISLDSEKAVNLSRNPTQNINPPRVRLVKPRALSSENPARRVCRSPVQRAPDAATIGGVSASSPRMSSSRKFFNSIVEGSQVRVATVDVWSSVLNDREEGRKPENPIWFYASRWTTPLGKGDNGESRLETEKNKGGVLNDTYEGDGVVLVEQKRKRRESEISDFNGPGTKGDWISPIFSSLWPAQCISFLVFKIITVKFVVTHSHQNISAYSNSSGVNVVILQRNKSVIKIKLQCIFPHLRLIPSNCGYIKPFGDTDTHFIPQDINLTKPSIKCSQPVNNTIEMNSRSQISFFSSKTNRALAENSKMDLVHHKILDELVRRQEDFQEPDKTGLICHGNKVIDYGGRMVLRYGASSLDKQPGI
nr:uncharacterized serine-rich protein C215.13-like [Ipomoea batatas]